MLLFLKRILVGLFCLSFILSLVACSPNEEKMKKEQDRLFHSQRRGLEKSKQVEKTLMDSAKRRDNDLRQQTRVNRKKQDDDWDWDKEEGSSSDE